MRRPWTEKEACVIAALIGVWVILICLFVGSMFWTVSSHEEAKKVKVVLD